MDNMAKEIKELTKKAEILKAMAHPVRLCIVKNLLEVDSCNVSTIQSCLEMPQSTVSQHLAKLKAAGIIEGERNGVEINYSVVNDDVKKTYQGNTLNEVGYNWTGGLLKYDNNTIFV